MTLAVVRGTGSIGSRHLRVLSSLGVDDLVAVPVRSGRTSSPELGDGRISRIIPDGADLVVVATDTSRHVGDAVEALEAGARVVLVEKPVAARVDQVGTLLDHPRASAVRVCAPLRFKAGMGAVRDALTNLDGPGAARVVCQSWLPDWRPDRDYRESYSARPDEGGVLRDMVHEIDYALWLFGTPSDLHGIVDPTPSPVLGLPVDEAADLFWRGATGVSVSHRIDYVTRPTRRTLEVTSPGGAIRWDVAAGRVESVSALGESTVLEFPVDRDPDAALAAQARELLGFAAGRPAPTAATLADGVRALQVGEQVRAGTTMSQHAHPGERVQDQP